MKTNIILLFFIIFAISCVDNVGENWKTFEGELVYSYLKNRPKQYSGFTEVLKRAGLKGMLSAYGEYTCFAPTNEAMRNYYHSLGVNFTIDSLRQGQIDTLAKGHVFQNRYHTSSFSNGVIPSLNMNFHYVAVEYDTIVGGILLNGDSRIIFKDNDVYNGVIQGVDRVLKLSTAQLPNLMKANKNISIFTEALHLTHLSDSILLLRDANYKPTKINWGFAGEEYIKQLPLRMYGYTAFVEDNDLLKANGINSLADLIRRAKELYPSSSEFDHDFTNRKNSLNQFIAYHLLDKAIYKNKFFYTRNAINGYTPDEFFETMLPNRIIRASKISGRTTLNANTNLTVHIVEAYNESALNGVYHLLDNMLVYDESVEEMLQNTRIRFDIASILPELTNNNIRGIDISTEVGQNFSGSNFGFKEGYFKHIKLKNDSRLIYVSASGDPELNSCAEFQRDHLRLAGEYDFTIRLLPVPPGTYELRIGIPDGGSSISQIYVDNKPIGIPTSFIIKDLAHFLPDAETNDNGIKNDQILRYKGYMKAPNTFMVKGNNRDFISARNGNENMRKIVGIFNFTNYQAHTLRLRSVMHGTRYFNIDYIELVPKSVYDPPGEGVYETRD